jgi:hypothetical protein
MSSDDPTSGVGSLPPDEPASLLPAHPPPPNLDVPRRTPATVEPISPLRAVAGALVAVAGVLLGIGALLWATDAPKGDPTLQSSQQQRSQLTGSPSPSPSTPSVMATRLPTLVQTSPLPARRPAVAGVTEVPGLAPMLPLTVLNNSRRHKLAERAAARFRAAGWPIKETGNFTGRVTETTVYYEPGQRASAERLHRMFPDVTRVRPRFDGLPGTGLTVVLTRSYDA